MTKGQRKENIEHWLLCLPALLKVLIFSYLPLIGLLMAFQFYIPRRGLFGSEWVGFQNFAYLFKSTIASRLIINAVVLNALGIVAGTVVSLIVGLVMFEVVNKVFVRASQTILIFPYFVSWPLVGVLVGSFLSERTGMLTNILYSIGGTRIDFYSEPGYWRAILTVTLVWKNSGLSAVMYYAFLIGVDKQLYEAAAIDGASKFRRMLHVSMPALNLMVVLGIIVSSANILRIDFNQVYFVTNNDPSLYKTTDVIETYMFRALRTEGDYSISTAVGLVQAAVGFVLTIVINYVSKKLSAQSLF
ncbi:MAG: ABC transporter permease subunit [Clostridiales bacterium]|jgi:putative aldouronate transport system permease protein|nr:ABC transporter permease subunit [Clostridiales bacterium]